ncbi:hypothetical protein COT63_02255 [Candidatus Shapirobacteria bacterium CG09_land_8_20_14_0_10_38_17]|uniref:DNA 3'-5' helicase n=1 Tax=Candidatus Shapirobacteria bacterium CG09_land_8_20_14_0_10_38_17 TaxID=1974884 RepID=A0A2H0WQT2_9BACT|nr:MAG: hypothetical protein COT63_02255 [Candidatus Shapirobacteria bacterium CG09_land_8_20_14_0_10_38_17]
MGDKKISLNQEQREAVRYKNGPLLIVAGAGTGKTMVITERIKYLISQGRAKTSEILALTFTEKAAREMEERVDVALPYGYTDIWIMTFHAFCDRVLKNEVVQIGLDPRYRLMTQAEAVQLLRRHLFDFKLVYFRPLGNPTKFIDGLLHHFSRLEDEDILPSQYLAWARQLTVKSSKSKVIRLKSCHRRDIMANPPQYEALGGKVKEEKIENRKYLELARAYQQYERIKVKEGLMDFGDLIGNILKLFRQRPNILTEYRKKFKYILVDEFQDTNIAQYQLLKLLAPPLANPSISVVSDDSQSIYKFRGAAVSNILQFMEDYPQAQSVVLLKNYRSTQKILDRAYRLIQYNNPDTLEAKLGINKNLQSTRGLGKDVEFVYALKGEDEAEAVAKAIESQKSKVKSLRWKDFAILVRANNHADPFAKALSYYGIPYQFLGPGMLFKKSEVKDIIAYLAVLNDFTNDPAMYRVLTMEIFSLSGRDLAAVVIFAKKIKLSLLETIEIILGEKEFIDKIKLPFISPKGQQILSKIVAMINRHLELVKKRQTAGQILYYFLEDSGILKKIAKIDSIVEEQRAQNISRFFEKLRQYELDHEDASVAAVVDWINLSQELGESPLSSEVDWFSDDRVNILTVHSAKGLEFRVVFLVNLISGRFPTYERREQIPLHQSLIKEILPSGDYHQQEERRLFYVGMTRAADRLFLTAANYYGEGKRIHKISPFVVEALEKDQRSNIKYQISNAKQLPILHFKSGKEPLQSNEVVKHPINYFSFSQIATFEHCPAQYRYAYIQRIPVSPTGVQNFGTAIHQTLFVFYKQAMVKKVGLETLLSLYEQNWLPFGFSSKAYEKRLKEEGREMLRNFYRDEFSLQNLPLFLEKRFTFFLTPKIKVGGIFDRVDKRGKILEIIDYKTGKMTTDKEVENSSQMAVYALAAIDSGILGAKPENLISTFYFLANGQKKSIRKSLERIKEDRKELIEKIKAIKKSNFSPRPSFWCDFCPYRIICDAWK